MHPPYLCFMIRFQLLLIAAIAFCTTESFAQFNTITERHGSIKTKQLVVPPTITPDTVDTKQTERTSNAIRIASPLRHVHITSSYGWRTDPITKKKAKHNGLDLRANFETAYAMLPGEIIKVGKDNRSGLYVTMRCGNITISYCHLSKVAVRKGQHVRAGQIICVTGSSGRSTGPHLHIGIKIDGKWTNPLYLIKAISR